MTSVGLAMCLPYSALFLKSGPIVQTKDYNGTTRISSDPDSGIAYSGPLVVLTSRQSASASEIFAAALQDYGRAVIVGDKNTFGKGTVQTILPIGRFASLLGSHSDEDGALKLTIQKFYRVAGGSTQLHGVTSDIVVPSLSDLPEFGEGALKNALAYDEVAKAKYTKWSDNHSLFIDQLRRRPLRAIGLFENILLLSIVEFRSSDIEGDTLARARALLKRSGTATEWPLVVWQTVE